MLLPSSQQSSLAVQHELPQHLFAFVQLALQGMGAHNERLQYCPAAHGRPQPPQFWLSVSIETQLLTQQVRPASQLPGQTPLGVGTSPSSPVWVPLCRLPQAPSSVSASKHALTSMPFGLGCEDLYMANPVIRVRFT